MSDATNYKLYYYDKDFDDLPSLTEYINWPFFIYYNPYLDIYFPQECICQYTDIEGNAHTKYCLSWGRFDEYQNRKTEEWDRPNSTKNLITYFGGYYTNHGVLKEVWVDWSGTLRLMRYATENVDESTYVLMIVEPIGHCDRHEQERPLQYFIINNVTDEDIVRNMIRDVADFKRRAWGGDYCNIIKEFEQFKHENVNLDKPKFKKPCTCFQLGYQTNKCLADEHECLGHFLKPCRSRICTCRGI